jgi:hypothetical protein
LRRKKRYKQFDKTMNFIKKELALYPEKRVILQDIAVCYYSLNDTKPLFHTYYEYLTIQILMMEKQNICYRVAITKYKTKQILVNT